MSNASGPAGRDNPRMRLVPAAAHSLETDADLVRAVRERAPQAAGRLWDRYSPLVRRILRRALGPSVDVEDSVQEAFLRLFRDVDTLRDPAAVRSFLIGITLHVGTSELRKRRARRWLSLSHDGRLPEPDPQLDAMHSQEREVLTQLYRVLDRMDAQRRMVFVLRYVEGLELAELSAVLQCSLATTKRRVADAAQRVCKLAAHDPLLAPYLPEDV